MIDHIEIDPRIKVTNPQELFKCDKVIMVNRFNDLAVQQFKADFLDAHETGQSIIPIIIDSFGGDIYSALAMADIINSTDKIVTTVAIGKAMSAGAFLLTCGHEDHRFASPNATIMIHDISSETDGKLEEMKNDIKEAERLNKIMFETMEKNCGLKRGELLEGLRSRGSIDWYMTAKEAKKLGIINHIRIPQMRTKITVETELT